MSWPPASRRSRLELVGALLGLCSLYLVAAEGASSLRPTGMASAQGIVTPTPTTRATPPPTPTPQSTSTPTPTPTPQPTGLPQPSSGHLDCLRPTLDTSSIFGGDDLIWVRFILIPDFSAPISRGHLRFDLSSIPANANVTSAQLRMYLHDAGYEPSVLIRVWRLTGAWSGDPPIAFPPVDARTIDSTPGWKSWNVRTLVQGWMSGAAANHGVAVGGQEFGAPGGPAPTFERTFRATEYAGGDFGPCLEVDYTVPAQVPTPGPGTPTFTPTRTATPVPTWTPGATWTTVPQTPTQFYSGDLEPVRIDVLQSVSPRFGTGDPPVPLIADKTTLVRVYVQLTGVDEPGSATVALNAFRGGSPVFPNSWCGTTHQTKTVNAGSLANPLVALLVRDDLSRTANFELHAFCNWVNQGQITFSATVTGDCIGCEGNNTMQGPPVAFHPVRAVIVKPYVITYAWPGSPNEGATPAWSSAGFDYLMSQWSVPGLVGFYAPEYLGAGAWDLDIYPGHDPADAVSDENPWWVDFGNFLDWFKTFGDGNADVALAVFDPNIFGCWGISGSHRAATGVGCGGTYAHEIGHAFGLRHSSDAHGECAGGACLPSWPYPHGGTAGHGWDRLQPNKLILPDGTQPTFWHSHDVMSYGGCATDAPTYADATPWYCANWISPTNYSWIAQRLRCADPQWSYDPYDEGYSDCWFNSAPFQQPFIDLGGSPASLTAGANLSPPPALAASGPGFVTAFAAAPGAQPAETRPYLRIGGLIRGETEAELTAFYILERSLGSADSVGRGAYRLELQASDGSVLEARNFDPARVSAHARLQRASIEEWLPWHPATARVVLQHGGSVLAERSVSPTAPRVTLLSPGGGELWREASDATIAWLAEDGDGDALTFWLQYSSDGGASWQTIQRDVPGNSYVVDLRNLPGSERARIRVLATDGINTAIDASRADFAVARKPPVVQITGARDDAEVSSASSLRLVGFASDPEDGPLNPSRLTWASDRDGVLGAGDRLHLTALSPGEHLITLSATDSDGMQGTASLRVVAR